jgi:hypothetical protein
MIKIAIGALCGVFIGAFAVELLKKKNPKFLQRIEKEAADLAASVRDAIGDDPVTDPKGS